jgi:hypothetical protein
MSAPVVTAPGFYPAFTEDQYHADPAPKPSMSSGIAATLLVGTPSQARHKHPRLNPGLEIEDNRKFDLGNVAHELVLGRGPGIVPLDYEDWRKKEAQQARDAAIADGKQPCLLKVYEQAQEMHAALRTQLGDDPENHDAFTNGVGEEALFWKAQTPMGQMWMRQLTDWRMTGRPAIYDYKTFAGERGADPEAFVKHIVGQGKDVQDPHYSRGLAAVLGIPVEEVVFRFVVQDPKPPYNVVVVELDAQTKEWSNQRWQWAVNRWAMCAASGAYPGFPSRTHYIGAPGWAQTQWEQKLIAEEMREAIEQRELEAAE